MGTENRIHRIATLARAATFWFALLAPSAGESSTLTVTSLANSGPGSLRAALAFAVDGDVIQFGVLGEIQLSSQLSVSESIEIRGPGSEGLALSGMYSTRLLEIPPGAVVLISDLTLQEGYAFSDLGIPEDETGGGVLNHGVLTLDSVVMAENVATQGGGAIANHGSLFVHGSRFEGNNTICTLPGSSIWNTGDAEVDQSVFWLNFCDGIGPEGASILNEGSLLLLDSQYKDVPIYIAPGGTAHIERVELLGGFGVEGANLGIENHGDLILIASRLVDLYPYEAFAGLCSTGSALVIDSEFLDNGPHAFSPLRLAPLVPQSLPCSWPLPFPFNVGSSGIINRGEMEIRGSTIAGNGGDFAGFLNFGNATVVSATISSNETFYEFSGARNYGTLEIINSTITQNIQGDPGPGNAALSNEGDLRISGSIVANQQSIWEQPSLADCHNAGTFTSGGYNIDSDGSCQFTGTGDQTADPLLGPLADNGGATQTHLPLPNSPAVNAIPAAECVYDDDGDPGTPEVPLATDQRGVLRPQGSGCDIGAVEVAPACSDGLDNDGDGMIDYPADPGCAYAVSGFENSKCQDGLDNDNQAGIDFDGGDSLDIDPRDGYIDADFNPATPEVGDPDPQCVGKPSRNSETSCGLGAELAFLLPPLLWLRQRRRGARA